eukprot:Platyproteum_vivax@DN5030_c0_g1_i1.p1
MAKSGILSSVAAGTGLFCIFLFYKRLPYVIKSVFPQYHVTGNFLETLIALMVPLLLYKALLPKVDGLFMSKVLHKWYNDDSFKMKHLLENLKIQCLIVVTSAIIGTIFKKHTVIPNLDWSSNYYYFFIIQVFFSFFYAVAEAVTLEKFPAAIGYLKVLYVALILMSKPYMQNKRSVVITTMLPVVYSIICPECFWSCLLCLIANLDGTVLGYIYVRAVGTSKIKTD